MLPNTFDLTDVKKEETSLLPIARSISEVLNQFSIRSLFRCGRTFSLSVLNRQKKNRSKRSGSHRKATAAEEAQEAASPELHGSRPALSGGGQRGGRRSARIWEGGGFAQVFHRSIEEWKSTMIIHDYFIIMHMGSWFSSSKAPQGVLYLHKYI